MTGIMLAGDKHSMKDSEVEKIVEDMEANKELQDQYIPKKNCKRCYGRGYITRTVPTGKKKMVNYETQCSCVTVIKAPLPDDGVAPKVKMD